MLGGGHCDNPRLACWLCLGQGGQQQDSHELMRCLVEGLHAEEQRALEQLRKKVRTHCSPSLKAYSGTLKVLRPT